MQFSLSPLTLLTRNSATAEIPRAVLHKPLPKTRFPGLRFYCWQYISSFREFDAVGSESCRVVWNNARWRPLGCWRSLKVTDFGTDRRPLCDFILVNNTNLCSMSHRFLVIPAYWPSYRFWHGRGCLYLTSSFRANLWTLAAKFLRNRQTDRQTERFQMAIAYF